MAVYGTLLQDPELGTASRMYLKRYLLEVQGFSREQIMVVYPYTPEEEQALADVEMLNINEELPAIEDINEDHLVYILIYDQAKDTEAKKKAIHARREAYKQSGQQQTHGLADAIPQPTSDPMSNMMINQLMNQHQSESIGAKTLGA